VHHLVLDDWSRGSSPLHRRDARAKLIALLVFLVAVATARGGFARLAAAYLALLGVAAVSAGLPARGLLLRACVVFPFTATFAGIVALGGDWQRAGMLLGKSYLSALAALLVVASTPMPALLRGLERLGAPRFLVLVAQFLYRYLFVLAEEAQHMRAAAAGRAGSAFRLRAAAGAVAVLFARAHARAEGIHHAMLARGFDGAFRPLRPARFGWRDAGFLAGAALLTLILRAALAGGAS